MKQTVLVTTLALAAAAVATPAVAQPFEREVLERPIPARRSAAPAPASLTPTATATAGTDQAEVISATPLLRQVLRPGRNCVDLPVAVQRQPSGAGALLGAVAGAALGNAVGGGSGRAAATAIGLVGGAALGNQVELGDADAASTRIERRCTSQGVVEDRVVGYAVVYEYNGRQFTTRMRDDPGDFVQVQVHATPVGESAPIYEAPSRQRRGQPVPLARGGSYELAPYPVEPVYETYPAYPAAPYYPPAYPDTYFAPSHAPSYLPFGAGLALGALIGFGFERGHWGHGAHGGYRGWRGGRH